MSPSKDLQIKDVTAWPVDIPLTDKFTISQGSIATAHNLFIKIALRNGTAGFGESAPFTGLTGETREKTYENINKIGRSIIDRPVTEFRDLCRTISEISPENPAARCGVEMAVLDAFCRVFKMPMWAFWGGGSTEKLETDITIPILEENRSLELGLHWHRKGFRIFKLKTGKNPDAELALIEKLSIGLSEISLIVDANQGFSENEALRFIKSLAKIGANIRMIEQPVDKGNIDALARLRRESPYPICADEAVTSAKDAVNVFKQSAADIINIKIMKCGVMEAFELAVLARSHGAEIMFGGMIETRLAMGCSLAMAAGLGKVHTLDLDTPLLMSSDPIKGGYQYKGAEMILSDLPGLGASPQILAS